MRHPSQPTERPSFLIIFFRSFHVLCCIHKNHDAARQYSPITLPSFTCIIIFFSIIMRLFGTSTTLVVVAAMTSSQCCAAQSVEMEISRAEPQHESLLERNLSDKNKSRRQEGTLSRRTLKFLLEETQTYTQFIIRPEGNYDKTEMRQLQGQPICNICREGKEVGNPDATAPVPGGQIPCDILQNMGIVGLIPSAQCDVLTLLIGTVCECESINPTTTTTGATNAPIITTEATAVNSTIIVAEKSGKAGKSSSAKASKSTYSGNSTSLDFNSTTLTTEGDDFNSTSLLIEEDTHNNSTSSKSSKSSSSSAKSSKSIHGNSTTSLFRGDDLNSTTLIETNNTNFTSLIDEVDSLFS